MELNAIAKLVDQFIQDQGGYWDIPWLLAAITEELGELSRIIQISAGIKPGHIPNQKNSYKELIEEETGDLLFALLCLTNFYNIDLEIAVINTLTKYESRVMEKKIQGELRKK